MPNDVMGNTPHNLVLTVYKINNGNMDGKRREQNENGCSFVRDFSKDDLLKRKE